MMQRQLLFLASALVFFVSLQLFEAQVIQRTQSNIFGGGHQASASPQADDDQIEDSGETEEDGGDGGGGGFVSGGPCVPNPSLFGGKFLSTVACSQVAVPVPFSLRWTGTDLGGIGDANLVGTGLRMVLPGAFGILYLNPTEIQNTPQGLQITTQAGLNYNTFEELVNCIGVGLKFTNNQPLIVSVNIVNPPMGSGSYEQAGILFGITQTSFVKVTFQSAPSGNVIQGLYQNNAVVIRTVNVPTQGMGVTLGLIIDPSTSTISAFFNRPNNLVAVFTGIPRSWFSPPAGQVDPQVGTQTFGCLFGSHRNRSTTLPAMVYTFQDFKVSAVGAN